MFLSKHFKLLQNLLFSYQKISPEKFTFTEKTQDRVSHFTGKDKKNEKGSNYL